MITHPLHGRRRLVATAALGVLAISQLMIGIWALFAPGHFYAAFPSSGHAWVALLPPYNEHLVRDVGALSLALTVVLVPAAVTTDRLLVRVAACAFAVYALPHTLFHGLHLHGFELGDAVAQMGGFVLQLGLVAAALLSTRHLTQEMIMKTNDLHVVVGAAGATGRRVVHCLLQQGHPVRAVSRDGRGPRLPGPDQPDRVTADALDRDCMIAACAGATTVYQCAMPPIERWRADFPVMTDAIIDGAAEAGARLVYADDTWMYGRVDGPMTPDTPCRPVSSQGVLRAWLAERMLTAAAGGRLPVSIIRAGELYGAEVRSMIAGNVFGAVARGRAVHWFGDPDLPITPTLVDDFARTIAAVGVGDTSLAAVWHVPHAEPTSGRELVAEASRQARTRARVMAHGSAQLRALGLLVPLARQGAELVYQFEQPFVVDGSATTARFGVQPTSYADGIASVLATPSS